MVSVTINFSMKSTNLLEYFSGGTAEIVEPNTNFLKAYSNFLE